MVLEAAPMKTVDDKFDMSAEVEKLRLYYAELKSKKEQQKALGRRTIQASKVNGWYEEGKLKVMTLREQEIEAKQDIPLVVPDYDPSPNHICNRLYEEHRDEFASIGREKRRGVEENRESNSVQRSQRPNSRTTQRPCSRTSRTTSVSSIGRKSEKMNSTAEEIVDRLYNKSTISLNLHQMAKFDSSCSIATKETSSSSSASS